MATCADANCGGSAGLGLDLGNSDTGAYTSLALDANGFPVISYQDFSTFDLKVMHCDNTTCLSNTNSVVAPYTTGQAGFYTSLALDRDGNPAVSFVESGAGANLRILRCGDVNCATGNVVSSPDTAQSGGSFTSLALDEEGNPVVSYYASGLKVLHCDNPYCLNLVPPVTIVDTDSDGYFDTAEAAITENHNLYCPIMRADVNHDGVVTIADLATVAGNFLQTVPPAPVRYDQRPLAERDGIITISDLALMASQFLQPVGACAA